MLAWSRHTARNGPSPGGSTRDARDDLLGETSMPFALVRPSLMNLAATPRTGIGLGSEAYPIGAPSSRVGERSPQDRSAGISP